MAKAVKAAIVVGLIATGVGAITGAVASGSAFSLFGTTLAKGSLSAYFATQFTTSLVLGAVSQAMNKGSSNGVASGSTITGRSPLSPHQIIYGRTRVGGNIVYMEGTNNNKYLHVVVAIAGHEIDAIEKYYFNDEEVVIDGSGNVTAGSYANKARIKFKLGTDDQTAFSELVSESASLWTSNHRLRGRAVVYIRLEYDSDKFPNGMPNFSFQVRGKKVYDPRTSTTVWSANPALCIADYLTNTRYGLGCVYANEIDEAALIAAANVCDEDVPLNAGGTENKYELHGSIVTSGTPEDIINQMLTTMAGKAIWTSGKWRILAGAYSTPTLTFDEDDLRSGFTVQSLVSRRENFNCIKGVFVSAQDKYMSVDFPPLISDAFIALDNGEPVYKNITLPFTTSVTMAQRLSKIELLKARQQITLTLPLKLPGLKANVGDIVYVNNTRMGWSSKPFEVVAMSMSLDEAPGVDLDLREISTDVYDWSTSEEQAYDPAPNTSLPNPFAVGAVTNIRANLDSYFDNNYGVVEWDSDDSMIDSYKVVINGDSGSGLTPINLNALVGYIAVYDRGIFNSNNKSFEKYFMQIQFTQAQYNQLKAGYSIFVDGLGFGAILITSLGKFDSGSGTPLQAVRELDYKAVPVDKFNLKFSSNNTFVGIKYEYSRDYPSNMVYQEFFTSEKKLGAIQFIPGFYQVSVTPRNILGVYGETESVIFPIPEPPLPGRVSGLEIDLGSDGESNSKEWTGRDAKIKWRPASVTLSYNLNDLEPFGLDSGGLDNYLKDYKVAVYNASGELLREEFVTTEAYVYTYEKNAEDAAKYGDTAYRQLEFKVWARGKQNQLSEQPATL
jgi:hypothetical protein